MHFYNEFKAFSCAPIYRGYFTRATRNIQANNKNKITQTKTTRSNSIALQITKTKHTSNCIEL